MSHLHLKLSFEIGAPILHARQLRLEKAGKLPRLNTHLLLSDPTQKQSSTLGASPLPVLRREMREAEQPASGRPRGPPDTKGVRVHPLSLLRLGPALPSSQKLRSNSVFKTRPCSMKLQVPIPPHLLELGLAGRSLRRHQVVDLLLTDGMLSPRLSSALSLCPQPPEHRGQPVPRPRQQLSRKSFSTFVNFLSVWNQRAPVPTPRSLPTPALVLAEHLRTHSHPAPSLLAASPL